MENSGRVSTSEEGAIELSQSITHESKIESPKTYCSGHMSRSTCQIDSIGCEYRRLRPPRPSAVGSPGSRSLHFAGSVMGNPFSLLQFRQNRIDPLSVSI